jgi:drug/metabolite transporter (DMT)-like permease
VSILAALGTSLTYGVSNYIAGLQSRRSALFAVVFFSQMAALVVALPLVLAVGEPFPDGPGLPAGILAGVGQAIALGAFYRALAIGTVSIVAPIGAVGVILPVLAGLLGGDSVTPVQVIGMALCVVGIGVAARRPDPGPSARRPAGPLSVGLALVAATCFGLQFIAFAEASADGVLWPITLARAASVVVLLGALVAVRPSLVAAEGTLPVIALVGILNHLASGLFVYAAGQGAPLSVVSVLASLYPAVTVVLALALLEERLTRPQALGVSSALLGVVLTAGGR